MERGWELSHIYAVMNSASQGDCCKRCDNLEPLSHKGSLLIGGPRQVRNSMAARCIN